MEVVGQLDGLQGRVFELVVDPLLNRILIAGETGYRSVKAITPSAPNAGATSAMPTAAADIGRFASAADIGEIDLQGSSEDLADTATYRITGSGTRRLALDEIECLLGVLQK